MKHSPTMKKFLAENKSGILSQRRDECDWYLMIIKWNIRDWEVIISRDSQNISSYTEQFDETNFEEPSPFFNQNETKIKGIVPRPRIHKLSAGKINGPQKKTIIELFKIPEQNTRRLKITKLDKE